MNRTRIDLDTPEWKGQWAMITGASSGIGREYALQLAAKGINTVLVARRAERLHALAQEIEQRYGAKTLVEVCDLAAPSAAENLRRQLESANLVIRILVNNAAFGRWGRCEQHPPALYQEMLQVDVVSPTRLCLELLPQLASYPSSAIIMLSSPAALQPVPYMAVYAAAKSYLHALGQALHGEWGERGILVQTVVPGPTQSEFDDLAGAYPSAIEHRQAPHAVVRASLRALTTGTPVVWQARNTYRQRMLSLLPVGLVIRIVARMFAPPA